MALATEQKVSHLVIMGDSLSDSGRMNDANKYGIPMKFPSGLAQYSPKGRFTNGYVWVDNISAILANKFTIETLKKKHAFDSTDIADAMITDDKTVKDAVHDSYNLQNYNGVKFNGLDLVRNYSEGGLTSHSYRGVPSSSLPRFFTRLLLTSLSKMRDKCFADDKANNVSLKHKAETLVVEWSGVNDFVTVNAKPSKAEADQAVKDRIKNVELMIKNGYRNFVLFNIPDLALTPEFKAKNSAAQKNAHDCCTYFNDELAKACKKLGEKYPESSIKMFDVNAIFTEAYNNPEKFGFDKSKLTTPFNTSKDFKKLPNGTAPANGYMFYDEKHPSAQTQYLIADLFYKYCEADYKFVAPTPELTRSVSAPNLLMRA